MKTKIAYTIIGITATLSLLMASSLVTSAFAKIAPATDPSCTNDGGSLPPGQQTSCKNDSGLTENPGSPATNPQGKAPPGQN
jgi:hypothetical protein